MKRLLRQFTDLIERLVERSGRAAAWLVLVLVGATVFDVTMRYVFRAGSVAVQELEWHLFAAIFLLAGAYTLRHDGHVRVDILYRSERLSDRTRRFIDALGTLLFLLPFTAVVVWSSIPFVVDAFVHGETSPDPGGLTQRWLVKALIPLGFGLLFLQGLATLLRAVLGAAGED
ncbi:MAG: TRAP transporter small permease subunit [Gammaproteobacteria bacterium]